MSNFVFNHFKALNAAGDLGLNAAGTVLRLLAIRDTSAYTPDKDDDFLDAFTGGGGVEISAAGYARQTLANKAVNKDDTNDRAEFDCDDVEFGNLPGPQVIEAFLLYQQVGGDDTSPEDDVLIAYIDTVAGDVPLPLTLTGAPVTFVVDVEGLLQLA